MMVMPSTGFITTTTTTMSVLPMQFGGTQFDNRVRHAYGNETVAVDSFTLLH
jgi:hypothetical protein